MATYLTSKEEDKKQMNSSDPQRKRQGAGSSKWHTVGSTGFANYWCDMRSLIAAFWRSTTWPRQSWRSERSNWTSILFTDKFLVFKAIQGLRVVYKNSLVHGSAGYPAGQQVQHGLVIRPWQAVGVRPVAGPEAALRKVPRQRRRQRTYIAVSGRANLRAFIRR